MSANIEVTAGVSRKSWEARSPAPCSLQSIVLATLSIRQRHEQGHVVAHWRWGPHVLFLRISAEGSV